MRVKIVSQGQLLRGRQNIGRLHTSYDNQVTIRLRFSCPDHFSCAINSTALTQVFLLWLDSLRVFTAYFEVSRQLLLFLSSLKTGSHEKLFGCLALIGGCSGPLVVCTTVSNPSRFFGHLWHLFLTVYFANSSFPPHSTWDFTSDRSLPYFIYRIFLIAFPDILSITGCFWPNRSSGSDS